MFFRCRTGKAVSRRFDIVRVKGIGFGRAPAAIISLLVWGLVGCAVKEASQKKTHPGTRERTERHASVAPLPEEPNMEFERLDARELSQPAARRYAKSVNPPDAFEALLDANPVPMPQIKPAEAVKASDFAMQAPTAKGASSAEPARTRFRVQLAALDGIEAAQERKRELEAQIGGGVDMVFDAPFYKLRVGPYSTRREAEDKLLELRAKGLQGFLVQQ